MENPFGFLAKYDWGGYICPNFLRNSIYRLSGNKIGKDVFLSSKIFLGYGRGKLIVGDYTFINYSCFFDLGDDVVIGSRVNIAMNVHFINSTHEIGLSEKRAGKSIVKKIYVGDGSWIGADCIIMPGVTIGKGCVIGAGSLILHDTEDNCVYVGRPARKLRALN